MSVVNKFNQKAKEYDSERRALIPCFDDFYGIAIDCIDFKGDNPKVLDLGAGTGILSQFLLEKYPNAEIEVGHFGPVIGTHLGEKAIGIAISAQ